MHHSKLEKLVERDPRYAYEAYEFVYAALEHTEHMLASTDAEVVDEDEEHHLTGQQLLQGIRDLALREFGMMARTVFRMWGIQKTDDFGEIVFNLVEANLMSKTEHDNRADFHDVYDLDEALVHHFSFDHEADAEEGL